MITVNYIDISKKTWFIEQLQDLQVNYLWTFEKSDKTSRSDVKTRARRTLKSDSWR